MALSENNHLLPEEPFERATMKHYNDVTPVTYKRRWYIVLLFASLVCMQSALCVVWLVTAESSEAVFGWTNADLSFMQVWIYVMFVIGLGPFAWLMQNKGMRVSTVIAAVLIFLSTLCRILTFTQPWVTGLAHIGHILTGISAPVLFMGSPVISAAWFPFTQRATATAIITTYGLSGTALIFLVDPHVVPSPITRTIEQTANVTTTREILNIPEMRQAIMNLRYSEFGIATFLLLLILIYFPAKPPSAPSLSAIVDKVAFRDGIKQLFSTRNANFWYVTIAAAISAGVFGVFGSMLDVILKDAGGSQKTAGWLSFCGTIGGTLAGIILGRLGDKCLGKRKTMLLIMTVLSVLSSFLFLLIVGKYVPYNTFGLFLSFVVLGASTNGVLPLYYEVAIETTFPISEGTTMTIITLSYNFLPIVFLMIPFIPNIGTMWMVWFTYGSMLVCVPLVLLYRERYDRLSMDDASAPKQ